MVRYHALSKFRNLSLQERLSLTVKHANDSVKLVRIGAAQLITGADSNGLTQTEQAAVNKAKSELEVMLYTNADFSTGRLQLGDYYLQHNDVKNAIKNYEMALQKDNLLIPVYSNLASAYSMNGQLDKALETLNTYISIDNKLARPYYLRALLYFEMKEFDLAVADLNKAIQLDPNDTRSRYNLATYYFQEKQLDKAEVQIKAALKIEPNNPDYKYLLALIYRDQGKIEAGQKILDELGATQ
jgi:Tfp pilus assembly protein PilF